MKSNLATRSILATTVALTALVAAPTNAMAERWFGCYDNYDYGNRIEVLATAEWIQDFFEIWGQIRSESFGVLRFKADGWSGSGRLFRGHEYEAGALYIQILPIDYQSFVLDVEGVGRFPFNKSTCPEFWRLN